jgi:uncharacterized protein YndB with AHSA1/START domain
MNAQAAADRNTDNTLVIQRTLAADTERVFQAWIDPAILVKWMGPGDISVSVAETDVRVGGAFKIVMDEPEGETYTATGTYEEIIDNEKLVFNWTWDHVDEVTLVTIALRAIGDNETELTLTHTGFAEKDVRDHHEQGWNGCLDKLPPVL